MTVVYYTHFKANISAELLENKLNSLPTYMRERIKSFKRWQDSLASLYGKLLLREGFAKFNVAATLDDLMYTEYNKPYLNGNSISFNISHSGNYVVCAISNEVDSLGVDIEEIKEINFNDFPKIWTEEEWRILVSSDIKVFYEYWTKKESILKADGRGLGLQLQSIDVRGARVEIDNKSYFISTLNLHNNYALHLTSLKKFDKVDLAFIKF
jgi:4'-phosphopantetheinyl transferase